jgi:NNP family nitrate/nitrite transporter-like MFS transporter
MSTITRTGHPATLVACFLHFDVSFMLWVLFGALGVYIAESAGLSAGEKALVVAVPILSGSLLRVPIGLLSDRWGARRVGAAMLAFLFVPLALGWRAGESLPALVVIGLLLGTAGASFAVALPLASRWYPPERQGLAMGIAAAGNSGTVITNLAAPRLAEIVGWHNVLGLAMLPLAIVLVAFVALARESPVQDTRPGGLGDVLRHADLWRFAMLYSVTFGGYVGLSSFLPIFFRDQYGVSGVTAGHWTALAALAGSAARPIGGHIADRWGGVPVVAALLAAITAAFVVAARLPPAGPMSLLLVALMCCLGLGNGAIFQLVPRRFSRSIGAATGMVGAIGGLGGFFVPVALGSLKQTTGSFSAGFLLLALGAGAAGLLLQALRLRQREWRVSWQPLRDPAVEGP